MNEYDKTANALAFSLDSEQEKEDVAQRLAYLERDQNQRQTGICGQNVLRPPTKPEIREKIEYRLNKAREEVRTCEELLGLLEKNKDTERILELLNQYL